MRSVPHRAMITVTPLNRTVRPAAAPALSTASSLPRPLASSSLKREIMNSA